MGLNTRDAKINRTVNMPSESFPFFMLLSIHKVSFQINHDRERRERETEREKERERGGKEEKGRMQSLQPGNKVRSYCHSSAGNSCCDHGSPSSYIQMK